MMNEGNGSQGITLNFNSPVLIRFTYEVKRWPDASALTDLPLGVQQRLSAINSKIDKYVDFIKARSMPGVKSNERFALATSSTSWLYTPNQLLALVPFDKIPKANGFLLLAIDDNPFCELVEDLVDLENKWDSILEEYRAENCSRVGFSLPPSQDLHTMFFVTLNVIAEESSLTILDKYSLLRPVTAQSHWHKKVDPDYWRLKHESLVAELRDGKLSEQEFQAALGILQSEKDVYEISDKMSDFL